jgi:hypothetical protein
MLILVGAAVLALAGFGAQAILTPKLGFSPAGVAPRADYGLAAPSEGAAPALDASGLERDLKEFVRGQTSAQVREGTTPAMDASGLERDLKAIWQSHMLAQANGGAALSVDTSGLERDVKEVVGDRMAAEPQAP